MKLIWCCLFAALLALSHAALDVEKTVKQVQSILQANELLPRLSREEIIQLLNDIRSEDAKSSVSKESREQGKKDKLSTSYSTIENEINSQEPNMKYNKISDEKEISTSSSTPASIAETTTKSNEPTLMVVLPYTPRDGSSLQELYTRPPRVEVVHVSSTTPKPTSSKPKAKPSSNLKDDNKLPAQLVDNFPSELQAFLDAHGVSGKPGQDHFLLPLDGFKPLPPAKVIDDSVQLPENILLTYDLISPNNDAKPNDDGTYPLTPNNFLYEPLRPELPFEMDTSSSEKKEVSLPYDMPIRNTKSIKSPNYETIDYDSVKVIPLNKGVNPVNEEVNGINDQSKRQASTEEESSAKAETTTISSIVAASDETTTSTTTTTTTEEPKTNVVSDSASADTDTGASLADLEDSFGGPIPEQPGDAELPPPRKNGFYWMLDWNSFLEVGDGDTKVNIRFEPKLGDPQMFLPVTVP